MSDGATSSGWRPPKLAAVDRRPPAAAEAPEATEVADRGVEEARREGREAGYEAGFAEGFAKGRTEAEARARQLQAILDALAAPFADSDAALLRETLMLTQRIVAAVLRRELRSDPRLVEGVLKDALAVLGDVRGDVEITLHPEDARLCRDLDIRFDPPLHLRESASMSRGGLTLHAGSELIDATVEARLEQVIAKLYEEAGLPEPAAATGVSGSGSADPGAGD